jgi:hypothetical protein
MTLILQTFVRTLIYKWFPSIIPSSHSIFENSETRFLISRTVQNSMSGQCALLHKTSDLTAFANRVPSARVHNHEKWWRHWKSNSNQMKVDNPNITTLLWWIRHSPRKQEIRSSIHQESLCKLQTDLRIPFCCRNEGTHQRDKSSTVPLMSIRANPEVWSSFITNFSGSRKSLHFNTIPRVQERTNPIFRRCLIVETNALHIPSAFILTSPAHRCANG